VAVQRQQHPAAGPLGAAQPPGQDYRGGDQDHTGGGVDGVRGAVGQAVPVQSSWPGIARFRAPCRSAGSVTWFDVFGGGCVTIQLRPAATVPAIDRDLPNQVPAIVGYVSRTQLQQDLARRSAGRLSLSLSQGPSS
jgi:hypothetical protein